MSEEYQVYTAVCLIRNGLHIIKGPDCPHDRTEDELGPIQPAGWTVQQAVQSNEENHG